MEYTSEKCRMRWFYLHAKRKIGDQEVQKAVSSESEREEEPVPQQKPSPQKPEDNAENVVNKQELFKPFKLKDPELTKNIVS